MKVDWRDHALAAKGFMPPDEGDALHRAASRATANVPGRPIVEIGSYCGRSTIWLAAAARDAGTVVVAVDHHRGSEENQRGWEHHDPSVVDGHTGLMDTLPFFRRVVFDAGLESSVVAVVGQSPVVADVLDGFTAAMVFIDGAHGAGHAAADYAGWAPKVAIGGVLAIHDVFADPADGGRPPYEEIYRPALESGRFRTISATGSLRVLERI